MMKIDTRQMIAGQPIRKIRDLMRFARGFGISAEKITERVGVDVTARLVAEGLIEPSETMPIQRGQKTQFYRVTMAGTRLAATRLNRRIRRQTAERIVDAFLERVVAVNEDADLLLTVVEVDAFGSFITDAPDLGDVDLAIRLEHKFPDQDWVDLNVARAAASGRSLNLLQRLFYGQNEVMQRLQNRNSYLSLHLFEELATLGCDRRRIYPSVARSSVTGSATDESPPVTFSSEHADCKPVCRPPEPSRHRTPTVPGSRPHRRRDRPGSHDHRARPAKPRFKPGHRSTSPSWGPTAARAS
jgi:hypothetical protein